MADVEPGDRAGPPSGRPGRQLDRAPGERYTTPGGAQGSGGERRRDALFAPLLKASVAAVAGTVVLYVLGALLSSSVGLVFVAGLTGTSVGLLLARAAAPGGGASPALTRGQATRLSVALAVAAVALAAVGTWLHAIGEGGALGPIDYLLETFGAIVPLELVFATVGAAWGAGAGPVER
jgi:hypothetical protein